MADLTNSVVQRYEQIPANQDVGDRFDQNNFYPMDGIDMNDQEYSEIFGLKRKSKGGAGLGAGALDLIKTQNTQQGLSRLEKRLAKRNERAGFRKKRRQARRDARQARKMQALPPQTKQNTGAVASSEPTVIAPAVQSTGQGTATPIQEAITDKVVAVANQVIADPQNTDIQAVADVLRTDVTDAGASQQQASAVLDEILDPSNPKGKPGWRGLSMGAKIGIIGGGAVVLGLIAFAVVKMRKNKAN